uniref:Heat shock cognate 70 kDa protein 2-like n=1 Tax=Tanacetum cinerariifolium TaxID=118510 RepID=A0A699IGF4_TANCI|nr:heat shock cognate 70 kDa protein 2-like [Tanacetum cinerariifolium]
MAIDDTKITNKNINITITNIKGRLLKKDIKRMAQKAKKYKAEDEEHEKKAKAKNALEKYVYDLSNAIIVAVDETMKWLNLNQLEDAEEFEYKMKELMVFARDSLIKPITETKYNVSKIIFDPNKRIKFYSFSSAFAALPI